ncbi:peptidase family M1 [Cooperia oncophora]
MEPTYARRMVPCLDEPSYKANWTVTVIHPKGTRAVSNGIETNGEGGRARRPGSFLNSKPLPNVVVLVGRLSSLNLNYRRFHKNRRTVPNMVTSRGKRDDTLRSIFWHQMLGILRRLLWHQIPSKETRCVPKNLITKYSAKKVVSFVRSTQYIPSDMVALPDFPSGAMENWGLITYRENSLLYDDRYYAPLNKHRVALVVAHELAHQAAVVLATLFTLRNGDDFLWLNEGFATFMEYIGTKEISDDKFRSKDYFLLDTIGGALEADAVASSHPLSFSNKTKCRSCRSFRLLSHTIREASAFLTNAQALLERII